MQKFKQLRGKPGRAWDWVAAAWQRQPKLFAHGHLCLLRPAAGLFDPYWRETVTYGSARAEVCQSLRLLT